MNLSNFKVEKLIQEDSFQRFSTGTLDEGSDEINLISIKNPTSILTSTRHLISDHLFNVITVFEDQNELHIALRKPVGISLESYLEAESREYDQRISLGLGLLKAIYKYDTFSNAIKYQLLADEQLIIDEDVVCFRELIDYTTITHHSFKDILFRLGRLLEKIIAPETETHQQFVDNLLIGNHHYYNLSDILKDYKDIFIYEKPESISKVTREYNIVLTETSTISGSADMNSKFEEMNVVSSSDETPQNYADFAKENLQSQLSALQSEAEIKPDIKLETPKENTNQTVSNSFDTLASDEDPFSESEVLRSELSKLLFDEPVHFSETSRLPNIDDMDTTFAEVRKAHLNTQTVKHTAKLPTWTEEEELEATVDLDALFDEEDDDLPPNGLKKILFPVLTTAFIILVLFFAGRAIFGHSDELKASFKIDTLDDNRVAFVNTSPDLKNLKVCEWTVYYDSQLIETYESENFYPIFDTDGKYDVVLRVQDKDGNWSKEFKEEYVYSSGQ